MALFTRALVRSTAAASVVAVSVVSSTGIVRAENLSDDTFSLRQCPAFEPLSSQEFSQSRFVEPVKAGAVRVATINAQLISDHEGGLAARLSNPNDERAQKLAQTLQEQRPKVVVLTGFDYDEDHAGLTNFHDNYVAQSQQDADPIQYPYRFTAPVNSGVDSGADLNKDGLVGGPEDTLGVGDFPGQGGMVVLSQLPIVEEDIRTFTDFKWQELPENQLDTTDFSELERAAMPLQSRGMWDVPVRSGRQIINIVVNHLDAAHEYGNEPTAQSRYQDQLRFLSSYLDGGAEAEFIVDDDGEAGGLTATAKVVVAGQLNADPAQEVAQRRFLNKFVSPQSLASEGAYELLGASGQQATMVEAQAEPGEFEGHRMNYVLADEGAFLVDGGVYWPVEDDAAVLPSPDDYGISYRLVWADISF